MTETAVLTPAVSHAPTRPVEVVPELRQVSRGSMTICSIYPEALSKAINHNGRTTYTIQAAPRGSYATLTVYDTQQWCQRPDPTEGKHQWMAMPIPAMIVAQDLVSSWAGNTLGKKSGFAPGIAIIENDVPTAKELQALRTSQDSLFHWYITDAMGKYMKGQGNEITDIHRLAAREMLDKGAERLPWFPTTDFAQVKNCIACGKQINATALRCDHCTTNLPDWYMSYDLDPTDDPVVATFIARIRSKRADVAPKSEVVTKSVMSADDLISKSKDAKLVSKG